MAQMSIEGEVNHANASMDMVTVQVYENGKILRTIAANKRGKYELVFPYNHEYILVYRRPYMIPVKIAVETNKPDGVQSNVTVAVPLNMELFKRFKGLDISAYKKPIGIVKGDGTGENSFAFFPDKGVLSEVKKVNDESIRRMNAGEDPIDSEEVLTDIAESPGKREKVSKSTPRSTANSEAKDEIEHEKGNKIAPTLDIEKGSADLSVERYDRMEEGQNESNRHERGKQIKKQASLTNESLEQESYIVSSKIGRSKQLESKSEETKGLADTRARKHEEMLESLQDNSKGPSAPRLRMGADKEPVMRKGSDGAFYSEELLTIKESGDTSKYKKVTYDWLLIEFDYYYRNDKEISEDTYNEARALFE